LTAVVAITLIAAAFVIRFLIPMRVAASHKGWDTAAAALPLTRRRVRAI
jgi:hypothetical protein